MQREGNLTHDDSHGRVPQHQPLSRLNEQNTRYSTDSISACVPTCVHPYMRCRGASLWLTPAALHPPGQRSRKFPHTLARPSYISARASGAPSAFSLGFTDLLESISRYTLAPPVSRLKRSKILLAYVRVYSNTYRERKYTKYKAKPPLR